jgi:uncharacterized membrane protein YdbT with pleckstrin-like domain
MDTKNLDQIEIKQTTVNMTIKLIVMQVLFSFLSLVTSLLSDSFNSFNNGRFINIITYDSATFVVFILLQLIFTIFILLEWSSETYTISSDKIEHKVGTFSRKTQSYSLKDIRSASITEGVMGRLFNYGSIILHSPTLDQNIILYNIASPALALKVIEKNSALLSSTKILYSKPFTD